jgi:glycosyltransferase involved in cell wall biosynthesis
MKCLLVYKDFPYPPKASGSKLRAYMLLNILNKLRIRTHCIFIDYSDVSAEGVKHLSSLCDSLKVIKATKSFGRQLQEKLNPGYPLFRPDYYNADFEEVVREQLRKNPFDFVLIGQDQTAVYFHLLKNTPIIFDPTDAWNLVIKTLIQYESNFLRKIYLKRQLKIVEQHIKRFYHIPDACLLATKYDAENILSLNSFVKARVLPNCVDIDFFTPSDDEEERIVAFHGVLNHKPNEDAIRWFCNFILPRLEGIKFFVIGRNPSPKIQRILGQYSTVNIFANVEDIRPYIQKSTIYVCPVRQGAGIKNKLLEAMAMGKPVIATSSSACSIFGAIESRSIIVADSSEEFVMQINQLLSNKIERRELAQNARQFVIKNFSFKKICKDFEIIVKQMLPQHRKL